MVLITFRYWLNFSILVSSEEKTIPQKHFFSHIFIRFKYAFLLRKWKPFKQYKLPTFLLSFHLTMQIIFFLQYNSIFFPLKSLCIWNDDFSFVVKFRQDIHSFLNKYRIKSNFWIIFLKIFPVFFSWWVIYSFPVIFIYKKLNFCYFLWFFPIFHDLIPTVIILIDRIYCCFFVFYPNRRLFIW